MNSELIFHRENLVKEPIFLTGLSRSGKTMLMPIIASFENVENIGLNYLMEQIPMIHDVKEMTDSAAVFMMRSAMNFMAYDQAIGRNVNFRYSDISSVWRAKNLAEYFQRLFSEEGDEVIERIARETPHYLLMVHNALWHADIYFKAFSGLKMVHIERHPIDIVYSWYKRGYYKDFADNPRNSMLTVRHNGENFLFYAHGWEEEYARMNQCDRTIAMVHNVYEKHQKAYQELSPEQKEQIKIVYFEHVVTETETAVKKIASFLNTKKSVCTDQECARERCPRVLNPEDYQNKWNELKSHASEYGIQLLHMMDEEYKRRLAIADQKGGGHELKK